MSTDNLTADQLSQLLTHCRERAALCASEWITGVHPLGEIYEEIESWYDRYREGNLPMPQYQDLPSPVQDQLFDAWIEGVEAYFAKRAAKSDSADSPLPVSVAQDDGCAVCGSTWKPSPAGICQYCLNPYRPVMVEDAVSSPSPASSVVPSPLVPEVVKASPEGSVCEVEPLGEILEDEGAFWTRLYFEDADGDSSCLSHSPDRIVLTGYQRGLSFCPSKAASLAAHLTAWLETGSFKLVPRAVSPSPDQSYLLREAHSFTDKTLLYLDEALIHSRDGRDAACEDAIKLSRHFTQQTLAKLNTALGEEQKGGAGV